MLNVLNDSVIGEYEANIDGDIHRAVLAKNGISEWYIDGKKTKEYKWIIGAPETVSIYDSDNCFYQTDLDVLQDFITNSAETISPC